MDSALESWLATAIKGDDPPATEAALYGVESLIGYRLPDELRHVLTLANRPEGFVGKSYLAFFNTDDLIQRWRDAQEAACGLVPFASNGAGEWYGLDSRLDVDWKGMGSSNVPWSHVGRIPGNTGVWKAV